MTSQIKAGVVAGLLGCVHCSLAEPASAAEAATPPPVRAQRTAERARASLAGEWRFRIDPQNVGVGERWQELRLQENLTLPGSLDSNGKGTLNAESSTDGLSRKYLPFRGKVWYQRDIEVADSWAGRRVALVLERSASSQVWLDDREAGETQASRHTPHVHELGELASPGRHTLTILAGSALPGRIELLATDRVWVRQVNVYPDIGARKARVSVEIANATRDTVKGVVRLEARSVNGSREHTPAPVDLEFAAQPGRQRFESELTMGEGMQRWDEFQPAFYQLAAALKATGDGASYADRMDTSFGMWEIAQRGAKLQFNGRTVFLRGRSAGANSPITGQQPYDVKAWRSFFRNNKDYGLNHLRAYGFPPEAAFEAADLEGVYIQAELGAGSPISMDRVEALVAEASALLETYGNHPSFCLFTLGNELWGEQAAMRQIISRLQARDHRRRLFASGSNNFYGVQECLEGDDFWVTWRTRRGSEGNVRASFSCADTPPGHIETGPPNTERDYGKALEGVPVPVIAHEIGEFQVYPNYDEIPKYTGVLLPRNLETFRKNLDKAGMLDQWPDFLRASGALAVLCYKEDIEAAHRTRGFGGYQILDLADQHVQGTALVGILDAFNQSKGLIQPESWRHFCNSTVPLLRFPKYTWSAAETFAAEVQVAHYGPAALRDALLAWTLKDQTGQVTRSGELRPASIPQGDAAKLGEISLPLNGLKSPARYDLELLVRGTPFRNQWPLWVFDSAIDTRLPSGVTVTRKLDATAQQNLVAGDKVLLIPDLEDLRANTQMAGKFVDGQFQTDFWSYSMFQRIATNLEMKPSPGTLGLLMNPNHAALAQFPTEFHSNWQWWHLVKNGRAVVLDAAPTGYRPIVQVIDNVNRNHKLGLVFEFRVGKGKLLICTADLLQLKDHPEAAQLLHSLLAYAASEKFDPAAAIDLTMLRKIMGILVIRA